MSGPIPQLVDISHALQSGIVQQIRSDVIQYSQLPQLSEEQVKKIDAYLQAINSALTHFTIDNQHIERVDDGVTDLDIQLYNGLRSMYTDYMTQLTALKLTKSPYAYQQQQQGPIQLQVQLPNQQQQQQQQIPITQNPGLAAQAVNAINGQYQFQFNPQSQYQLQPQPQLQPQLQLQQSTSTIQGQPTMVQPEGYNPIQQQQQQQPMLAQPQLEPQQEFQAQPQVEQQTQGVTDEDTAKRILQERKEQKAREEEKRINENIKILEYIHGELPYRKPSERRKYIDTLAENETKVPLIIKSEEFLDSMSKLCALDIDNAENIRSYIRLLKMLGYSKSKLRASLPQSLTAPSPSPSSSLPSSSNVTSTATSSNAPGAGAGANTANTTSSTSSSLVSSGKTKARTTKVKRSKTKTETKTDKSTASKSKIKQRDIPPVEVYIADKKDKDKDTARVSSPTTSSSSSSAETASSAVGAESVSNVAGVNEGTVSLGTQGENNNNNANTNTTTNNENGTKNTNGDENSSNTKLDKSSNDGKPQEKASEAQNRKKISFSSYIKKEDSKDHTVSTKRSLETDKTSTTGIPDDGTIRKKVKSAAEPYTTSSTTPGLKSILKNSLDSNTGTEASSRKSKTIRFQNDSDLVRVYGDGLPSEGLKVLPKELKKLLRPFKAGVPNEKLLLGDFIQKPRLLHLDIDVQNSDISETKGGPVPCDTKTPPYYRENFRNFNKKLTSPPSERLMDATFQDPALLQEELGRSPIIAGAFGRNGLLLRSDRGGIPYRNVPVVTRNKYPPRYSRPSRAV